MTRHVEISNRFTAYALRGILLLTLLLGSTWPAGGQATPYNTNSNSNFWTPPNNSPVNMALPQPTSSPGYNGWQAPTANPWPQTSSPMMAPSPNSYPSIDQTRWYINNSPYFANIDPGIKQAMIYSGAGSGLLSSSYLPNGSPNPFYQNGQVVSNWYVPSTWSSPQMNWQGVQQNGFVPQTSQGTYSGSTFNWNSNTTSRYSVSPAINTNYQPRYSSSAPVSSQPSSLNIARLANQNQFGTSSKGAAQVAQAHVPSENDLLKAAHQATRASELHETADDKIAEAIDHSELARVFLQKDDPDRALKEISVADPAAAAVGNPALETDILEIKAAALMSSGDFEQALTVYREVMRQFRLQKDEAGQAETFASLGWAFQALGRDAEAFDAYNGAFVIFQRLQNREGEARALIGIGSLYGSMGDSQKALREYTQASWFASDDQFARILVSTAELLQSNGADIRALTAYRKALSLMRPDADHGLLGAIYAGIGRSHRSLNRYYEARSDFEQAEAQMKMAGDRRGLAGVIASLAGLSYWVNLTSGRQPNFSEAMAGYGTALTMMRETGDREGEIGVLTDMGRVFEAQGKLHKAIDSYCQGLAKLEDLRNSARLEEFRMNLSGQSESLYSRVVELQVRTHKMTEAFNFSERARARSFLDLLGNTRNNSPQEVSKDFVALQENLRAENIRLERQLGQEFSKPLPEVDPQRARSLQTQLSMVREKYQQKLDELKTSNPYYASFLSVAPLNLPEVQQQLAPDVTLLSYFTLPDMTVAFVVTRNGFHTVRLPITEDNLAFAINAFLDFAGEGETSRLAKILYDTLIAPLRSQLKNRTLLVSPYGVLHNLPFGALSPDGSQFLADSYSITLLPSISAWPYLRSKNNRAVTNALVMANGDVEGLPFLESGRSEAETVASLFGSKPLFGKEASVSTLREHGGEFSIVHLMAHLDNDIQNPRSSHFVLDQDLNIDEVLGLNLQKTDLVVLSGCQSDKGERTRGDDVVAISRAFMYAGAPSVLASLWSVDDESTRQLMVAFYSHLRDGLGKAEALQAAQKDVRRTFPNPYYWASFVLMGDPGTSTKSPVAAVSRP
jgi:CHAT domain-containing protein/predicted negative regulator of RcsB-dependent stress response